MVDSSCKKFRDKEDWNPNNFDMEINPDEIPANIELVNSSQVQYALQKLMPLSKKIHFKYRTPPQELGACNNMFLSTKLRINGEKVKFI